MSDVVILQGEQIADYEDEYGNRIVGAPESQGPLAKVVFRGSNNTLIFGGEVFWNCNVTFKQSGGSVQIGDRSRPRGSIDVGRDASLTVGKRLTATGPWRVVTDDGAAITIGDDCLFAQGINLRAYDDHPIYDLDTRERINYSRPIEIGSDVWLGFEVVVLGGAVIGHGSIIGTKSLVTASRPVGEHCLAVGSPAVVKRRRVAWRKQGNPPADTLSASLHSAC